MDFMPEDQPVNEMPPAESIDSELSLSETPPDLDPALPSAPAPVASRTIAPLWHTGLLVIAILAYSIWGAMGAKSGVSNPLTPVDHAVRATQAVAHGSDHLRLIRYALTGALELLVVGWVALGLRLRNVSFRSLFGAWPKGLNNITMEAGIAALFWICSMAVLLVLALTWSIVQDRVSGYHAQSSAASQPASGSPGKPDTHPQVKSPLPKSSQQQQAEMAKQLMELAPANGIEIAAWGLLCLIVGFSEELIFRGYLQAQSIGVLHSIPISVALTAVIFGAAHGYQGVRGIVLISVYGALFGIITLLRKNLFPGMLAHSWHDFATGLALAAIRSSHLLDHLPSSK